MESIKCFGRDEDRDMKIAIFGKMTNNWGLEGNIVRASVGREDIFISDLKIFNEGDYFTTGKYASSEEYGALVFLQGRNIDRERLGKERRKKILWNAEFLPYKGFEKNKEAQARLAMIEPLEDFDLILNGCPLSTEFLKEKRGLNIKWFPMMGVDPSFHRNLEIEKDVDIGFYGVPCPRRIRIWNDLLKLAKQHSYSPLNLVWKQVYGEDLIQFINQTKVMLNLHYSDLLNTESRIYEILGCGGFCLSEPLSLQGKFLNGIHLEECSDGEAKFDSIVQRAITIVNHQEGYAKRIAQNGYEYVHKEVSISKVLERLQGEIRSL